MDRVTLLQYEALTVGKCDLDSSRQYVVPLFAGSLEQSNVDLTNEFTQMIVTQRGFQASARTITTSDEMLSELVNLKR